MDTAGGEATGAEVGTGPTVETANDLEIGGERPGACARGESRTPRQPSRSPPTWPQTAHAAYVCAGQSGVNTRQADWRVCATDRLNSAPTASRKPQLAVLFSKSDFHGYSWFLGAFARLLLRSLIPYVSQSAIVIRCLVQFYQLSLAPPRTYIPSRSRGDELMNDILSRGSVSLGDRG